MNKSNYKLVHKMGHITPLLTLPRLYDNLSIREQNVRMIYTKHLILCTHCSVSCILCIFCLNLRFM